MAATDQEEGGRSRLSSFIVPRIPMVSSSVSRLKKWPGMGWTIVNLFFKNARFRKQISLERGAGLKQALSGLNLGRIVFGALGAGLIQACLDECISYSKQRQQFGKPISSSNSYKRK